MPNYCNNYLEVSGNDMHKFCNDVKTEDQPLSFDKLIPTPKEELSKEEFTNLMTEEEKNNPFFDYYVNSHRDWYGFRIIKWGTKWEPSDIDINHTDDELTYDFITAWSPPEIWLKNIAKNYDCIFTLTSFEIGSDFWSQIKIDNGNIIKEESFTILEKVGIDLKLNPNYKTTKQQFIEIVCNMEEFDDRLEDMEEFAFIGENLEHQFSESFIYDYFEEIKNALDYLRPLIANRKKKIKIIQFHNFCIKQSLFNELTEFHTCPPIGEKLLKKGGALYQEAEINFYRKNK